MTLRALTFTGLSLTIALASCGESSEPSTPPDRTQAATAPEHCDLLVSSTPYCTPQPGSGGAAPEYVMGGAAGMGGQAAELPNPAPGCLIAQDVTLRCPSAVAGLSWARSADERLDVLVAQRGLSATDRYGTPSSENLAYVEALRFDGATQEKNEQVTPPFVVTDPPTRVLGLIPAGDGFDTSWVSHQNQSDTASELVVAPLFGSGEAHTFALDVPLRASAHGFTTSRGEGVFVESGFNASSHVIRGLPATLELISVPSQWATTITSNAAGELRALVHDGSSVTELFGPALDQPGFTLPGEAGSSMPDLDLLYAGEAETPIVLMRNGGSDRFRVYVVDDAGQPSAPAYVGRSSNTCDTFYVGLLCDECPEGQKCEARLDVIRGAKLFSQGERVFVAYVAVDRTEKKVIDLEETGFGLGCSCTPDDDGEEEAADLLVVAEVFPPSAGSPPQLVEIMRQELGAARQVNYVSFERAPQGTLDVVLGPWLSRFDGSLLEFPESPTELRIVRLDPSVVQ